VITVNGKERPVPEPGTVAGLLATLGLEGGFALVERNGEPVARSDYATAEIEDGDALVVARPVAGG
jgi:sulfur carrier protein